MNKINKYLVTKLCIIAFLIIFAKWSFAVIFENFEDNPTNKWEFISDKVMGGVSNGQVIYLTEGDFSFARMTGNVSLENDGGFIQFRKEVNGDEHDDSRGLEVNVRGNNQKYFLHIRTFGTILPWQYYQAPFEVTKEWKRIKITYDSFKRSGVMLFKKFKPKNITSIAIVAYGYEHKVLIDVENISFY